MGTYISQSDVESFWGSKSVAQWLDMDRDGNADSGRMTTAIAYAEGYVEDRMRRGRWEVPLSFAGNSLTVLKTVCAIHAGHWLYMARQSMDEAESDRMARQVAWANNVIDGWVSGRITPDAASAVDDPRAPTVVY